MYSVYLLIGSNDGNRLMQLEMASNMLREKAGQLLNYSSIYETASWGIEDLPSHYNQALHLHTDATPIELLNIIHEIENILGRQRQQKWGLRSIDIDIIYFEDFIIKEAHLCIPHPLLQERKFALTPIAEIAIDFIHPVLLKTNKELLESCKDKLSVTKLPTIAE